MNRTKLNKQEKINGWKRQKNEKNRELEKGIQGIKGSTVMKKK